MMGWPEDQSFSLQKYKYSLYLFGSMLAVVFGVVLGTSPIVAAVGIMVLGILKQLVWDVFCKRQKFDLTDILFMLIGCAFGFIFTHGYWLVVR